MSETRVEQRKPQFSSAIGGGGRLSRRILAWQALAAVVVMLLLLVAKHVIASREVGLNPLAALQGRTIVAGMDIGAVPDDFDLDVLATTYNVDGLINLNGPSIAEQVTASSLHIGYLQLPVAQGAAPTSDELNALVGFMGKYATRGNYIYLHDDVGGPRAVTTASMLLLLHGVPWPTVQQVLTPTALSTLSRSQSTAIAQLVSALGANGKPITGNPYSGKDIHTW